MKLVSFLKEIGFTENETPYRNEYGDYIYDYVKGKYSRVVLAENIDRIQISVYNKHIFNKLIATTEQEALAFLKEKFIE